MHNVMIQSIGTGVRILALLLGGLGLQIPNFFFFNPQLRMF